MTQDLLFHGFLVVIFITALKEVKSMSISDQPICHDLITECIQQHPQIDTFTIFDAFARLSLSQPDGLEDICRATNAVTDCVIVRQGRHPCYSLYNASKYRFFIKLCHRGLDRILFHPRLDNCWNHPFYYSQAVDCYRRYGYPEPAGQLPLFPSPPPVQREMDCFPSLSRRCRAHANVHLYRWVIRRPY